MPIKPENRARYPADWAEISRRIRFERAAGRCECEGECGRGTHKGRCTNVHGGEAPERCEDANLKAMCQGCHLHYDRDHHAQTAYKSRREGKAMSELWDEWDDYEEDGPLDLEDQLDKALERAK